MTEIKKVMTCQHSFPGLMLRRFLLESPAQEPITSRLWTHSNPHQTLPLAISSQDPGLTRANLALFGMLNRYLREVDDEEPITSRLWVPFSPVGGENEGNHAGDECEYDNEMDSYAKKGERNWKKGPEKPEELENSSEKEDGNSYAKETCYDKEQAEKNESENEMEEDEGDRIGEERIGTEEEMR